MPHYKNGKLYKLEHPDGRFFLGSTTLTLPQRKTNLRRDSSTSYVNRQFTADDWGKVKIVLIREVPCDNKTQLDKALHDLLETHKTDPKCLNNKKLIQANQATLEERVKALESQLTALQTSKET